MNRDDATCLSLKAAFVPIFYFVRLCRGDKCTRVWRTTSQAKRGPRSRLPLSSTRSDPKKEKPAFDIRRSYGSDRQLRVGEASPISTLHRLVPTVINQLKS